MIVEKKENDREGWLEQGDWDFPTVLRDLAKYWWELLLFSLSAAMLAYTFLGLRNQDTYTVGTTIAVMGKGNSMTLSSAELSRMTEKFQLILENNILKKEVKKELGLSSFPAVLKAEQIPESNLIEVKVTAATPEMAFRVLKIICVMRTIIAVGDNSR